MTANQRGPTQGTIEEAWAILAQEDADTLDDRAARLVEISPLLQVGEDGVVVGGGLETYHALWEAGMAYVGGMWLSTILTVLAVLERLIASSLYVGGLDAAARMRAEDLIKEATKAGQLTTEMKVDLDALRAIRNGIAHFQPPDKWMPRLREKIERGLNLQESLREDALKAIHLMTSYLRVNGGFP